MRSHQDLYIMTQGYQPTMIFSIFCHWTLKIDSQKFWNKVFIKYSTLFEVLTFNPSAIYCIVTYHVNHIVQYHKEKLWIFQMIFIETSITCSDTTTEWIWIIFMSFSSGSCALSKMFSALSPKTWFGTSLLLYI